MSLSAIWEKVKVLCLTLAIQRVPFILTPFYAVGYKNLHELLFVFLSTSNEQMRYFLTIVLSLSHFMFSNQFHF